MHRPQLVLLLPGGILLGSIAWLACGCGSGSDGPSTTTSTTNIFADVADITVDDVAIRVLGVPFEKVMEFGTGGRRNETTIGGHEFGIDAGVLWIGDRRYGAVSPRDEVVVTAEGVTVNDEPRGPLP